MGTSMAMAPSPGTPGPLPSPLLLGLVGSGVLRGLRGMMISSTLTPSSVCFSETWDKSSDWLGEKRLQHLHMKMAVFSVKKKKKKANFYFILTKITIASNRQRKILKAAFVSHGRPPTDRVPPMDTSRPGSLLLTARGPTCQKILSSELQNLSPSSV